MTLIHHYSPVLPCIYKPKKGSQKQIRFYVLIVNKTIQAINVPLLRISKLENKFLLVKPDVLIVFLYDTSLIIVLNPRNVIFVKVNIIFQFVIQKSKTQKQMIRETL